MEGDVLTARQGADRDSTSKVEMLTIGAAPVSSSIAACRRMGSESSGACEDAAGGAGGEGVPATAYPTAEALACAVGEGDGRETGGLVSMGDGVDVGEGPAAGVGATGAFIKGTVNVKYCSIVGVFA